MSWRLRAATYTPGTIVVPADVELIGLGENSIVDGAVTNNGILTNLQVTGVISGTGAIRMVSNPTVQLFNRQIQSTLAEGTAPFDVSSLTLNANLNADLLDGVHGDDYLTEVEHTAIGDAAPHHAAVTLDGNVATVFDIAAQQLSFDLQTTKTFFSGPAAGVPAAPEFRVMATADLPDPVAFNASTELTIAAGVIAATQTYHSVDTQGDDPTDDLVTINGGAVGDLLTIHAANDARTVVIKHNTGNIWIIGEADISLEDTEDNILLIYDGAMWCTLGDGGGAAVVDAADVTYTPAVPGDWDGGDPGDASDAFDELAERTKDIEDLTAGVIGASWNIDGALVVLADVGEQWVMPEACTIVEVIAVVKENGAANSTIVDVHKNGVTLFTDQGDRPEIAHDDADNYDVGVPDITAIAQYDEITLDIDAIATDATDLRVILVIEGIGGGGGGGGGGADILEVQVFL